ncbi:MAG TPA: type II toxin-antitoxin system death-on-curing family toxin [Rariglobus sp.]|jgi:death-on-curing protein|nr:type II toxin-antitoxin system death-on-curing family toxin [Rariglobus sp.]
MSGEPVFLSIAQVTALHRYSLEQHGGQDGLRDQAAFESAVQHPQTVWFYGQGDLFDVAAAYAFHLAESQAFLDGNKRTGMASALTFLRLNGKTVTKHTDELHTAMIAIAKRQIGKPELAALLRRLST